MAKKNKATVSAGRSAGSANTNTSTSSATPNKQNAANASSSSFEFPKPYTTDQKVDDFLKKYNLHCESNGIRDDERGAYMAQLLPKHLLPWFSLPDKEVNNWDSTQSWLQKVMGHEHPQDSTFTPKYVCFLNYQRLVELGIKRAGRGPYKMNRLFVCQYQFYATEALDAGYITSYIRFDNLRKINTNAYYKAINCNSVLKSAKLTLEGNFGPNASDLDRLWDELIWSLLEGSESMFESVAQECADSGEDKGGEEVVNEQENYCIFCGDDNHLSDGCEQLQAMVDQGLLQKKDDRWFDNHGNPIDNYYPDFIMANAEFNRYLRSCVTGKTSTKPKTELAPCPDGLKTLQFEMSDILEYKYKMSPIDFMAMSPELCQMVIDRCDEVNDFIQYPFDIRPMVNDIVNNKIVELMKVYKDDGTLNVANGKMGSNTANRLSPKSQAPANNSSLNTNVKQDVQKEKETPRQQQQQQQQQQGPRELKENPNTNNTQASAKTKETKQATTGPLKTTEPGPKSPMIKCGQYDFEKVLFDWSSSQNMINAATARKLQLKVDKPKTLPPGNAEFTKNFVGLTVLTLQVNGLYYTISAAVTKQALGATLVLGAQFKRQARWSTSGDTVTITDPKFNATTDFPVKSVCIKKLDS